MSTSYVDLGETVADWDETVADWGEAAAVLRKLKTISLLENLRGGLDATRNYDDNLKK